MKGTTILCSFMLMVMVLTTGTTTWAGANSGSNVIREHFLRAQPTVREVTQELGQQPGTLEGASNWTPGMKKPGRALIYSAFIPGTGELYVGAEKRGIAFLAMEVAAWTWYFTQHSSGKDKEGQYEDFAQDYWYQETYLKWYGDWLHQYTIVLGGDTTDFEHLFTHQLPDQMDGDYYEMIGKYDQFSVGWIGDTDEYESEYINYLYFAPNDTIWINGQKIGYPRSTYVIARGGNSAATVNRDKYTNMRGDANKLLKRATWGISAALFNHVISAVDAALAAKTYNKGILQEARHPQLRMEVGRYAGEYIPKLTLTQKF